jgi:hypothetical protein
VGEEGEPTERLHEGHRPLVAEAQGRGSLAKNELRVTELVEVRYADRAILTESADTGWTSWSNNA